MDDEYICCECKKGPEDCKCFDETNLSAVASNDGVMPDPDGVNLDKRAFVRKQVGEMMDKIRPFVRCGCLRMLKMHEAYQCLYCGESYCATCAEIHFGKTRAEYQEEKKA